MEFHIAIGATLRRPRCASTNPCARWILRRWSTSTAQPCALRPRSAPPNCIACSPLRGYRDCVEPADAAAVDLLRRVQRMSSFRNEGATLGEFDVYGFVSHAGHAIAECLDAAGVDAAASTRIATRHARCDRVAARRHRATRKLRRSGASDQARTLLAGGQQAFAPRRRINRLPREPRRYRTGCRHSARRDRTAG